MARIDDYEIPDTGAVFTFGRSRFADNLSSHFFVRNDPVLEISCGDEHTALVCKSGRVFLFGKNDYGQLGFGHTKVVNKPSCLKYLKPFQSIHVACGKSHTIISTACCRLFTFGCNSDGQLGVGDQDDRSVPQMVSTGLMEGDSIVMVSAGCHHSAFLTGKGELYLWGNNADGQCGANSGKQFFTPQKIEFQRPITSVSCGYYHTALISDGQTYTFGEEDNGKLGRPSGVPNYVPGKVEIGEESVAVKCGGSHTIIQTSSGKAFAFGSNFSGQLGIGNFDPEISVPQGVTFPNENIKLTFISCGESHSAFLTDDGRLYTCGDARHGKLCNEDDSTNLMTPTAVETFDNYSCSFVSCGGCHTMLLAKLRAPKKDTVSELLPPLRLPKVTGEAEKIIESPKKPNDEDESSTNLENRNEPEECDSKSNTESNLNDEIPINEDDIYTEIKEVKSHSDGRAEIVANEIKDAQVDMIVVAKEGAIKRFLNKLKIKKSPSNNFTEVKCDETQEVDVVVKGNQTVSKTCIIL